MDLIRNFPSKTPSFKVIQPGIFPALSRNIFVSFTSNASMGKMRKTFKYRLYPSKDQLARLEQTLTTCRILYNSALAERKSAWDTEGRSVGYHEQAVALRARKRENPYLPQVHSQVLQDVLRRVDRSFKNFFRRVKNGEKPGYPRFKGRDRYDSFTFPQSGFAINGKKLVLSKIGAVSIKRHRPIEGEVKTCTIRRDIDRWFACFTVELPDVEKVEPKTAVGVDVGLLRLVTLSTGETFENPKYIKKAERKLKREQRRLSRKKKGSRNRAKQRIKVAMAHRKVREQRKDALHKLSRELVDRFDLVAFEDLLIKNMLKNHYLAGSISDAAWHMLQGFTAYKAEEAGKHVAFAVPHGTSQECSVCGAMMSLTLGQRTFRCSCCGNIKDRDHNSAINILKRVGWDAPELTPVDRTTTAESLVDDEASGLAEAGSPGL
jgi:putative transposase